MHAHERRRLVAILAPRSLWHHVVKRPVLVMRSLR